MEPASVDTPPELVLLTDYMDNSPITADQVCSWTCRDPILAPVVQFLQQGWPSQVDPDLTPFFSRKAELSLYEGCVLWGTRVVLPEPGRAAVLAQLHEGHPGMSRLKGLARMYVWWPGIIGDIERAVHDCAQCQCNQSQPAVAPLCPWSWPSRPWA